MLTLFVFVGELLSYLLYLCLLKSSCRAYVISVRRGSSCLIYFICVCRRAHVVLTLFVFVGGAPVLFSLFVFVEEVMSCLCYLFL